MLTVQDPRFLPVTFNGRTYITSTLLHKQKREGGMSKYERLDHFIRMIREIDCFGRLVESVDIVELDSKLLKTLSSPELGEVMKSNSYRALLLISPTAQKEIEHFLDDEQSKDSAVQSSQVSAILGGGYGLESAGKLIDLLYGNYKQLETQNLQLAQERDHAIRAKGQISSTREAETMGKLSGLVRHMRKRGIAVPPFVETDNEEDSSEEVQKLEEQVKKLDKALEEYRRKENLQEEENQTYHPTSKNGIGINDALRKWGLSLTTTNSREINASIRSYLINIGGEILWTDSTFKGAPSKRCVWHPRFLDKNKGRILNFLTNEGWLKKA